MPLSLISIEPREPVNGEKVTVKFEVRNDMSFAHPYMLKVIKDTGELLAAKELGTIVPGQTIEDSISFKVETDKDVFDAEIDLWVEIEALSLLDDYRKIEIPVIHGKRWFRWPFRK